jgi:hypothetical protein
MARRRARLDWDELVLVALASVWQCRLELSLLIGAVGTQREPSESRQQLARRPRSSIRD